MYLGVLFHWTDGAAVALAHRDDAGWKALGALRRQLELVPFLPFARTVEMGEAVVGGALGYSAELWAPFLLARGTATNRSYLNWLLGFGKARLARSRGWLPLRDLDGKACAAVVRVLEDAQRLGGLLLRAVRQLHVNWASAVGARVRGSTWFGCALRQVRTVWPLFDVRFEPTFAVLAGFLSTLPLSQQYVMDRERVLGAQRQAVLRAAPPTLYQQDYIFARIMSHFERTAVTAAVFPILPTAPTGSIRVMLRTLAGMEDFARVNSHHARAGTHPGLSEHSFGRKCLSCYYRRGTLTLDSEWHSILACPLHDKTRREFILSTGLRDPFRTVCSIDKLLQLIIHIRMDQKQVHAFARFLYQIQFSRRRMFRHLSSAGPRTTLANLLEQLNEI